MLFKAHYLSFNQLLGNNTNTSAVEDAWPSGQKFGKIFLIWFKRETILNITIIYITLEMYSK